MAEHLEIADGSKESKYLTLLPQIKALLEVEDDLIACLANIASMIEETFDFWWVGFYRKIGNQLVLGPFQGPLACTRINYGKGVCGTAWKESKTLIVPNVDEFPGHIACSGASKSEIVVPIVKNGEVIAVIDIDSENYNTFDETDALYLEQIAIALSTKF